MIEGQCLFLDVLYEYLENFNQNIFEVYRGDVNKGDSLLPRKTQLPDARGVMPFLEILQICNSIHESLHRY